MNTPKYLYIILLSLIVLSGRAQSYFFKQYTVKDGLPQSQVNAVMQDSRGLLWLGTAGGGVAVYDGNNFQIINEQNGLGGNIVLSIAEGVDGEIYIGSTWGGISKVENMKLKPLIAEGEFSTLRAEQMMVDKDNRLWISNSGGVFYYDETGINKINFDDTLSHSIQKIAIQGNRVWAVSENSIYRVYPKSKLVKSIYTGDLNISSIFVNKEEELCVGFENGGIKYLDSVYCRTGIDKLNADFPELTVVDFKKDLNNDLWVLTKSKGIFKIINKNDYIHFDLTNGLPTLNLLSIAVDDYNTLWIGTGGDGVLKYDDNPFISFSDVQGFRDSDNFAVLKASDGSLWTGNASKGVSILKDGKVSHLSTANGLPSNTCFTIEEGSNGNIWIGTSKGLVKWNNGIEYTITQKDGLPNDFITCIEFQKESIFVGTRGAGLVKITKGDVKVYGSEYGIGSLYVHSILSDGDELWFGTGDGLYKLKNDIVERFSTQQNLCNSYVGNIVKDNNDVIWVGTDRCIASLKNGEFLNYNTNEGLFSDVVYSMVTDNSGNIWVGSNLGLDKLTLNENSDIVAIKHYGYTEGFRGVECNSHGVCKDNDGNLYFTTIDGVYEYQPALDYRINTITQVYITEARTMERDSVNIYSGNINWFGVGDSMTVASGNNYISIRFKGIDLKNADNLSYSYKLNGFDKMWLTTNNNEAIYSNLPPGKYTFRVSACPYGNCANSNESVLYLTVKDPPVPYYRSKIAVFFYVLIVIAILFYFTVYRGIRLKRQNELLEKKVRERTVKILKQNEEKTIMLQEIHHRVKNNLQIINSLFNIQKRYTDSAEAIELFNASQTRVLAMAKIHEKLYESKNLSQVNVREYVYDLIVDIKHNYELDKNILLNLEIEDIEMKMDILIPFALIINEIISNSFKYAFKDMITGRIDVKINQSITGVTHVYIADNGKGMERKIWDNSKSMGMELIHTLGEQIDANIELKTTEGTAYIIDFKM